MLVEDVEVKDDLLMMLCVGILMRILCRIVDMKKMVKLVV